MLNLTLDPSECVLLQEELSRALNGLRHELAHTSMRAYRSQLRERLEVLERIDARLAAQHPRVDEASAP